MPAAGISYAGVAGLVEGGFAYRGAAGLAVYGLEREAGLEVVGFASQTPALVPDLGARLRARALLLLCWCRAEALSS